LMLSLAYYANNYASIIDSGLVGRLVKNCSENLKTGAKIR